MRESETSLQTLDRLRTPIWIFDTDHKRIHWSNQSGLELWQADSLAELQSRDMGADMQPSIAQRLLQYQRDFIRHDACFTESWTLYPKGQPLTLNVIFSGYRLPDGRMAMFCEGLGEQKNTPPETLRSAEALLYTTVMITLFDTQGLPLYRNPSARDAVLDPTATAKAHFVREADYRKLLREVIAKGEGRLIAQINTSRGERWHEISARLCRDAVAGLNACLVSEVDVSELKQTEARANHLAHHDILTGLPNRNFVLYGFQKRLNEIRQQHLSAALMFIDLDRFKNVNDSLGHAAGDQLLVQMADRLRSVIRAPDVVARLGGDEFLVLAAADNIADHVLALGERIQQSIAKPMTISGCEVCVTSSIGVSLFPSDADDLGTLMRQADLAIYRSKETGRNRVAFFTPELNTVAQQRITLESELRHALDHGQFVVHYQPRVCVHNNHILGAEALVRWQHPQRGLLAPGNFIALCEETGLIEALGAYVLEEAAMQQVAWAQQGFPLRISVNLSPRQFLDTHFVQTVCEIVERTGCNPQQLQLEITESLLLGNAEGTLEILQALNGMGFSFAIDDFGTGYSNLAYLQRYPISCLKIDRSFIHSLEGTEPITELIVNMSRLLKLSIVAEGVETAIQLDWLRQHHCEEYQGFLFSSAVSASQFSKLLTSQWAFPRASLAQS